MYYDKGKKIPGWKLENANWDSFQETRANRCIKLQEENQMDPNIFHSELVNEIMKSAEEIMPKSTECPRKVSWWNSDCNKAGKAGNETSRKLKTLNS